MTDKRDLFDLLRTGFKMTLKSTVNRDAIYTVNVPPREWNPYELIDENEIVVPGVPGRHFHDGLTVFELDRLLGTDTFITWYDVEVHDESFNAIGTASEREA